MAAAPPPFAARDTRLSPSGPFRPGSSGGGATFQVDYFSPEAAQIIFNLSATPADAAQVLLWVNGVLYENGSDYIVVGSVVTWADALFALGPPDFVEAYYQT